MLLGRPVLWGLTLGGQRGVEQVLRALQSELELAMASPFGRRLVHQLFCDTSLLHEDRACCMRASDYSRRLRVGGSHAAVRPVYMRKPADAQSP